MPLLSLPAIAFLAFAVPSEQVPSASVARVTVQITSGPTEPKFEEFLKSLPQTPVQIDPGQLQATLVAAASPVATDTLLSAKLRAAYLQLTPQQRLNNEPTWKYMINPILWLKRTQSMTLDWWRSYKTTLPVNRVQINEVFPFAYDTNSPGQSEARVRARLMMNQGIDAAMGQGDLVRAQDLMYKAVNADPTYFLSPYNAGVLQMCRYNFAAAITMFNECSKRNPPLIIQEHVDTYRENTRRMIIMLLNNSGSQRRIYTEYIDGAWVLYNLGEYRAAAVFAGQAAALDPGEARPEAHFLIAMICAQQNRLPDAVRWLQYCLERSRGSASKIVGAALKDAQEAAAAAAPSAPGISPAAVRPPTNNPATTGSAVSPSGS